MIYLHVLVDLALVVGLIVTMVVTRRVRAVRAISIVAGDSAVQALKIARQTRKEQRRLMDQISRLESLVNRLNETITAEAEQVNAKLDELREAIANVPGISVENAAKLSAIADQIESSIGRVAAIVPDEQTGEPADPPADPEPEAPAEGEEAEADDVAASLD